MTHWDEHGRPIYGPAWEWDYWMGLVTGVAIGAAIVGLIWWLT